MGILEKIKEIEHEMTKTQKNKATEYHLGTLKAKLAKLRTQLLEPPKSAGGVGEGFDVQKFGHGRVALIGFPSVGKSTLLSTMTKTESEAASYEFTTLTCIPGVIHYKDAKIQLLDLPGIIEGASEGKGRGRQVIAVAKSADLIMMVLDASKYEMDNHRNILTRELEAVGLRLNKKPPEIYFKKKKMGGITFNSTVPMTKMDEKLVNQILHEYKIHHCELLFREDASVDELIDCIEGNRRYVPCLFVYNKADMVSVEEVDALARTKYSVAISCYLELGLDYLLETMWEAMGLVRVYTKKQGNKPDFAEPVILSADRGGITVDEACKHLHRDLARQLEYAAVWGTSSKHYPQRCGGAHTLEDEDVIQIVKKKKAVADNAELRGRFRTEKDEPKRIADRVKKAALKS
eukprot:CAMPEP_0198210694 /NCGR_PEP_ID=MMETSP1445-20131203/21715_1 /TAXON_ID=36898 /ORGANISM="Pyramimonas sp., Strain CCMP2087" /LENGTH=404 /DNA_ID=CAMNT_0043884819 /DNA_START=148 /DNA_END=1362 /DNA_ORIENTATION=-